MKKLGIVVISLVALTTFMGSAICDAEVRKTVRNSLELIEAVNIPKPAMHAESTIIYIDPNTYVIYDTLRINQSNLTVIAAPGTKIVLADHINKPVLAIGGQEEIPSQIVENIYISGIEIDGNKVKQDSEYDSSLPWIRNNGIDVRGVKRLTLENVISRNNRSGGLVISWGSSDIHINNSVFSENTFDGVAYYDSTKIFTNNSTMKSNEKAGISLDNNFRDSIFSNCILDSNGDVGIFMRYSSRIRFGDCAIQESVSYAAFLSHDDSNNGVHDVMFSGCHILNNNGGIIVSSNNQSDYTSIAGCVFRGNEKNGRTSIDSTGSTIWQSGNIMQ